MRAEADREKAEGSEYYEAKLAGLYQDYYDKIARYAYVHIGNRTEAEDIAGEVFLKALQSLKSYQERGAPMQAWLFRIAHNLVVDHLRKMTKRKTVPIDTVPVEGDVDPAYVAEKNVEFEKVTRAMEQLTGEQRKVLGLRFFGGLTSKEAGSILNKSHGAVREMQRAAIEKLRQILVTD
ncbi:ECF RNA polymerase sigma factor SigD [subsurface metagenome]